MSHMRLASALQQRHCVHLAPGRVVVTGLERGGAVAVGARSKRSALRSRNQQNRLFALAVAACAGLTLTSCSDKDTGTDAASPAPTKSRSSAPTASPTAQPADAVKEAYQRYWDAQVKAYAKGDAKGTGLSVYSAALALSKTKNDLKDLREKGIVTTGAPTHDVQVTSFKPDEKVPQAKLTDCLDTSAWKFIYRESRKPVEMPKGRLVRYVTEIEAEKWGKQWKVLNVVQQQRAC